MARLIPQIHSWWLLCLAAIITMAIVAASQLFTDRIGRLLDQQASELLAADLVITSSEPLAGDYAGQAEQMGLTTAEVIELRSAVFIDDEPQLVEVKAAAPGYPLRGRLERRTGLTDPPEAVTTGPERGEIWVDNKLVGSLGTELELGYQSYPVNWLLSYEPDRGGSLFNLAPRVLMHLDDLDATGLLAPGSRAKYKLLVAGEPELVERFMAEIKSQLIPGERLQSLDNARPEMRRALSRTDRFFSLSIIMTLVIAMVAIAITARYAASREAVKVAVMRTFGISSRRLVGYYLMQILRVWAWALLPGILFGLLAQYPLQWALGFWFGSSLPQASWQPFALAAGIGLISLLGFSLPALVNVIDTPPMQVLREFKHGARKPRAWVLAGSSLATLYVVLLLIVPEMMMATMLFGAIIVIALVIPAILRFLLYLYAGIGRQRFWLRSYVLSRVMSANRNALFVMSGFSLTLLSVLLISSVKDQLITDWETQLPQDTPNYFLVNIPTVDVEALTEFLDQRNIETSGAYALVRSRLKAINDQDIANLEFSGDRAQHFKNHVFNISFSDKLPKDNAVLDGQWIGAGDGSDEFSVEEGMAKNLNLKLGDRLRFNVGGEDFEAPITSIRSVVWENFSPNFYLISNPNLLRDKPQTWLLSARIDEADKSVLKPMIKRFPAVTLLDISEVMRRIKGIIDRASLALQFFFGFAMLAAVIVLFAALNAANQERQMEVALLQALGAGRGKKLRSQLAEFVLMGGFVGVFAAAFATLTGYIVGRQFFDLDFSLDPQLWIYSIISAVVAISVLGMLFVLRGLNVSPMKLLRS